MTGVAVAWARLEPRARDHELAPGPEAPVWIQVFHRRRRAVEDHGIYFAESIRVPCFCDPVSRAWWPDRIISGNADRGMPPMYLRCMNPA